jgi:hypothetical protein
MMRSLAAVGVTACVLLTASAAHAQEKTFGEKGEFIIGVDRLIPVLAYTHFSTEAPLPAGATNATDSGDQSSFSLLYGATIDGCRGVGASAGAGPCQSELFFTVPRAGFDYVLAPNVTIGGDLVLFFTLGGSTSHEVDFANGTSRTDTVSSPKTTLFGVAPRGGYILHMSDLVSLWLRGGLSYYIASTKTVVDAMTTQTVDQHQFALDLEPQFVFTPIPHLGFTAALNVDIPFGGNTSTETDTPGMSTTFSAGSSIFYLGGTIGMLGWF